MITRNFKIKYIASSCNKCIISSSISIFKMDQQSYFMFEALGSISVAILKA